MLLAIPFGLGIGVVVGAVGGGGAILTVPVLIYVLGEDAGAATTASLVVAAAAAAVAGGALARRGHVCWRLALAFAGPAAAGSLAGAIANHAVSAATLTLTFVPVMLAAASATWRRANAAKAPPEGAGCPSHLVARGALAGLGVGVLTGFFGVGGGFAIVPALTLWLGVSFRRAVATSLVIVTLTSLAALGSHALVGLSLDVGVTTVLAGGTVAGALAGSALGPRLPQAALARGFAVVVTVVALLLLVDVVAVNGPPGA